MANKSYPYIFIHGMLGFGQDEKVNDFLPYWGMLAGDVCQMIRDNGGEAYAPTISSLGSAWDRACEIYAQLVGGTVDYGEAHSKKYGHARYGRTYDKPLVSNWSAENKIHILGHSFGGTTVRMVSHLLAHGAPEEVAATGADTSPFFTGGKGDWLQSVTTVAGPHDGTTVIYAIGPLLPILKCITFFGFAGVMDNTPLGKFYDMSLDQWGITSDPRKGYKVTNMLKVPNMIKAMTSKYKPAALDKTYTMVIAGFDRNNTYRNYTSTIVNYNDIYNMKFGDANKDDAIDVSDITTTAAYILGDKPANFNRFSADIDKDGVITIADITAIAAMILGNE